MSELDKKFILVYLPYRSAVSRSCLVIDDDVVFLHPIGWHVKG